MSAAEQACVSSNSLLHVADAVGLSASATDFPCRSIRYPQELRKNSWLFSVTDFTDFACEFHFNNFLFLTLLGNFTERSLFNAYKGLLNVLKNSQNKKINTKRRIDTKITTVSCTWSQHDLWPSCVVGHPYELVKWYAQATKCTSSARKKMEKNKITTCE